ncbi:hypothetical protein NPIL_616581 [Nephila pilipes]|uniref:Uncharacterized protein n=1 Tax=Nephila pilipes TaxID=299642 RepID=A0A8X6T9J9_NEPPI|nr:hypothetical protein NPIL_616581 [Nephila pilipes]
MLVTNFHFIVHTSSIDVIFEKTPLTKITRIQIRIIEWTGCLPKLSCTMKVGRTVIKEMWEIEVQKFKKSVVATLTYAGCTYLVRQQHLETASPLSVINGGLMQPI